MDNQKLSELIKKVDSNFENVMMAQNLFLESCHRVQMDESQLETQISIVLDKLIDTFENKTAVGPRDIKHLEHLIRNHDSNIRKSVYHITSHLLNLIQKNSDNKDEIVEYVKSHLLQLGALHTLVQDSLYTKSTSQDKDILHELQIMHEAINKTQESLEQINILNFYITKMLNTSESRKLTNVTKFDEVLQNTKNISFVLNSIEQTINKSYLNIFLNKNNIEMARQFGKQLNENIQWIAEKYSSVYRKNMTNVFAETIHLSQTLLDILNFKLDSSTQTTKQINKPINTDDENIILLCNNNNSNSSCKKRPIMYTHTPLGSATNRNTDDSNNLQVENSLPINHKDNTRINISNDTLNMTIEEIHQNNKININKAAKRNDLPTNLSLYIIKHNSINTNTETPQEHNDSKNAYEFKEIKSKHFLNNKAVNKDPEQVTLNHPPLTIQNKIQLTSANPTLINLINSNLSSGSNSNLSSKLHTNTSHNNTAVTEEINTSIEDIEQLFRTTESAEYLQTEDQLSYSTTPSTTAEQKSLLVKNLVSTVFDDVQSPD